MTAFNDPPWNPISDPVDLKNLGKLGEEVGELTIELGTLSRIISRCIIQGLSEADPASGEINRDALQKEMADVIAGMELCCERFGLKIDPERIARKKSQLRQWHEAA